MTTRTRLGYVVDFCPLCIQPRVCALEELQGEDAEGAGMLVEHQCVCMQCQIAARTEATRYAHVAAMPANLHELQLSTFPNLAQWYQPRLDLEQQVAADPAQVAPDLREQLMLEPLRLLSAHLRTRPAPSDPAYITSDVLPLLRGTLARIAPSRQEAAEVLRQLSAQGEFIAGLLGVDDLLPATVSPQTSSSAAMPPATEPVSTSVPAPMPVSPAPTAGVRSPATGPALEPGTTATRSKPNYQGHASIIFQLCGWLTVAVLAIVALADDTFSDANSLQVFLAVFGAIAALMFALGRGIRLRANWARIVGLLIAGLFLIGFPIGTAVGGYLLYCLVIHWDAQVDSA